MNKKIKKDKRNEIIIDRISNGFTWDDLEREFDLTRSYMQNCLREHFENDKRKYKVLLAVARSNEKGKVIYIAETGVLIGHPAIFRNKNRIFVPNFCRKEIANLQVRNNEDYTDIIKHPKICWSEIGWESITTIPNRNMKHRTIGITAFSCTIAKRNKETAVKLYTNSRDIEELVNVQNIPNLAVIKL